MQGPVRAEGGGVRIRPEDMEPERMYHCVAGGRLMLVFKDAAGMLNCYEVEDPALVALAGECGGDPARLEEALRGYAARAG